jgi:hypothetical protein
MHTWFPDWIRVMIIIIVVNMCGMLKQVGRDDVARNAIADLLVACAKRDAFYQLRTVEQVLTPTCMGCMSAFLSLALSSCLAVCLSVCLSVFLSNWLFVVLYTGVRLCLCLPAVRGSGARCGWLSWQTFLCLSIHPSICLSVCQFMCMHVCLSTALFRFLLGLRVSGLHPFVMTCYLSVIPSFCLYHGVWLPICLLACGPSVRLSVILS